MHLIQRLQQPQRRLLRTRTRAQNLPPSTPPIGFFVRLSSLTPLLMLALLVVSVVATPPRANPSRAPQSPEIKISPYRVPPPPPLHRRRRRPDPPNPTELAAAPSTPSEPADRPPTRPATEPTADHAIPTSLHTGVRLWWGERTLSTEQMHGEVTRRGRGDVARDHQQPCAHAPAPWGVSLT